MSCTQCFGGHSQCEGCAIQTCTGTSLDQNLQHSWPITSMHRLFKPIGNFRMAAVDGFWLPPCPTVQPPIHGRAQPFAFGHVYISQSLSYFWPPCRLLYILIIVSFIYDVRVGSRTKTICPKPMSKQLMSSNMCWIVFPTVAVPRNSFTTSGCGCGGGYQQMLHMFRPFLSP